MASSSATRRLQQDELFRLIENGEYCRLKTLVVRISVSVPNHAGVTALHWAAALGCSKTCEALRFCEECEFDFQPRDRLGFTPLHRAVYEHKNSNALVFIKDCADVNIRTKAGETPLHFAAQTGNTTLMDILISRGADVDAKSDFGTPLYFAALKGEHEAVKLLLSHHANPNLIPVGAYSPLLGAIFKPSCECVKLLLEAGARADDVSYKTTPLGAAVVAGVPSIVELLLAHGANVNVSDVYGLTPLELAASRGKNEILSLLLNVTSPISTIHEWSLDGVLKHCCSEKFEEQLKLKKTEAISLYKQEAANAFQAGKYVQSHYWYILAIDEDPMDATLRSNISQCWALLQSGHNAMEHAKVCHTLKPDWSVAYYREGVAWSLLGCFFLASKCFKEVLRLTKDPAEKHDAEKALENASESYMNYFGYSLANWIATDTSHPKRKLDLS